MFGKDAKLIRNQGEKIIELDNYKKELEKENKDLSKKVFEANCECLKWIGALEDAQEEFLNILENLEKILTTNNYGRPDIVISKAIAEIKYQKQIIEEDKKIESDNDNDID